MDIYARLSRNPEGKIEKIEDQIADCMAVAERRGLVVGQVNADDNFSAWKRNVRRPGWEAMLERIESGKADATVAIEPFRKIARAERAAIEPEADALMRFAVPEANTHGIRMQR